MPGLLQTIFNTYMGNRANWRAEAEKRREEKRQASNLALRTAPQNAPGSLLKTLLIANGVSPEEADQISALQDRNLAADQAEKDIQSRNQRYADQERRIGSLRDDINSATTPPEDYIESQIPYGPAPATEAPLYSALRNMAKAKGSQIASDEVRRAEDQSMQRARFKKEMQPNVPDITDDIRAFNSYLNFAELKFPPDPDTGDPDPRAQAFAEKHFAAKSNLADMTADANNILNGPEAQAKYLFEEYSDNRERVLIEIQQSIKNGDMSPGEAQAVMSAYLKLVPLYLNRPPTTPAQETPAPKFYENL